MVNYVKYILMSQGTEGAKLEPFWNEIEMKDHLCNVFYSNNNNLFFPVSDTRGRKEEFLLDVSFLHVLLRKGNFIFLLLN